MNNNQPVKKPQSGSGKEPFIKFKTLFGTMKGNDESNYYNPFTGLILFQVKASPPGGRDLLIELQLVTLPFSPGRRGQGDEALFPVFDILIHPVQNLPVFMKN